jgi:NitT/TauT family transport system ATP-binding protein
MTNLGRESALLEMNCVSHTYDSKRGINTALEGIDLQIEPREIVALVGPSGCGKTTLINLFAGFLEPTAGEVFVEGKKAHHMRGRVGLIQQTDSLFPWLTIAENVRYPLRLKRVADTPAVPTVVESLLQVGLEAYSKSWVRELSGGMRKRAELARVIAQNAEVWLLDEPFVGLDVQAREEMQLLLLRLWAIQHRTILITGHDLEEAAYLSNRVILLSRSPGRLAVEYAIPFEYPRAPDLKLRPEFIAIRSRMTNDLRAVARTRDDI